MNDQDDVDGEIYLVSVDVSSTYVHDFSEPPSKEGEVEATTAWLITFTDVMALMLTFFVLLFAMSNPDPKPWKEVSEALHSEFNKFDGPKFHRGQLDKVNLNKINFNKALNLKYLYALIESIISDNPSLENVILIKQDDHIIISLPQDLLFDAGQANVKEDGMRVIYALGGALSRIKNSVEVIGHADPRPIEGAQSSYDNNWALSLARATSVAGWLDTVGYNRNIIVRGLSSGRYDDLAGILDTEQERLDISRRVDIIVRNHDGTKSKVFFTLEVH